MRVYVYEDRNDRVCPFSPVVITSPASLIFAISVSKPIIARTMRILISQSGYSKIHSSFDRRVRRTSNLSVDQSPPPIKSWIIHEFFVKHQHFRYKLTLV